MMEARASLERRLIELAWRDQVFADLLQSNPKAALTMIGVDVAPEVEIEIILQDRDTLYYVIPPSADVPSHGDEIIDQMDLWQSAELFCWIMPQALKIELLAMRQSYRKNGK